MQRRLARLWLTCQADLSKRSPTHVRVCCLLSHLARGQIDESASFDQAVIVKWPHLRHEYRQVIKDPMDLETISKRVGQSHALAPHPSPSRSGASIRRLLDLACGRCLVVGWSFLANRPRDCAHKLNRPYSRVQWFSVLRRRQIDANHYKFFQLDAFLKDFSQIGWVVVVAGGLHGRRML